MSKITKTATLSNQSLQQLINDVKQYKNNLNKGVNNGVQKATELMYKYVKEYARSVIDNHIDEIKMEYDKTKNIGKVYTNNWVIIFNEMGTGIVGSNNPHPSPLVKNWEYDVNKHGEEGWIYPKEDGTFGRTSGLPSRQMFYKAYNQIKKEIGNIVSMEISRKVSGY